MQIDEERLEKFKQLYFEEFGEKLSNQEAYRKFLRVINLMRIILRQKVKKNEVKDKNPMMF